MREEGNRHGGVIKTIHARVYKVMRTGAIRKFFQFSHDYMRKSYPMVLACKWPGSHGEIAQLVEQRTENPCAPVRCRLFSARAAALHRIRFNGCQPSKGGWIFKTST